MSEPAELTKAREILGKFEVEIHRPTAFEHLVEGLSLLASVRDADPDSLGQVATSVAHVYAGKVQSEVELLLSRQVIHWKVIGHWQSIFLAFEAAGFSLPEGATAARSRLLLKKVQDDIGHMSAPEREDLMRQLKEMDP